MKKEYILSITILLTFIFHSFSQGGIKWAPDGKSYYNREGNIIYKVLLPSQSKIKLFDLGVLPKEQSGKAPSIQSFSITTDESKMLLFGNTVRVWRQNTKGAYWVCDLTKSTFSKLGKGLPESSLMFAKLSPNAEKAAYVSNFNIYVEDLKTGVRKLLTKGGNRKNIFGTFDWAYEEEFFCRDGFRWSPDGVSLAYWQVDARTTKDYIMLDATDSIYPSPVPLEYPIAGEKPSPVKIGVVNVNTAKTIFLKLPDDPQWGSYIPRMEWAPSGQQIIVQHLNRKQNESSLLLCNPASGTSATLFKESDSAWIDILPLWDTDYANGGWDWLQKGACFLWASESDGWRHLFNVSMETGKSTLITKGNFDVMDIVRVDERNNYVYFHASPENATQKYLYRSKLDGSGSPERLTPQNQSGMHNYNLGPEGRYAMHRFSSHKIKPLSEWIDMQTGKSIVGEGIGEKIIKMKPESSSASFLQIKTAEGISMDAWRVLPTGFDSTRKYPIVFYVYTEPWGQLVRDEYGGQTNHLYDGDMAKDGYIYIAIDNRGTPVPKGRQWRKSVYRKIGLVNIRDQAMAAKEILKWPFVDTSRVAVWGWSGGGSATLNLMFQYPEIYKTGIAIAAVGNQLTYDNIYQERYMGLPQENREDFVNGSPMTHASKLQGKLLYIHGTGDDNVHYNNCEMLVNELVKAGKTFQLMIYPNRTHGISEGEGTSAHLSKLYTEFLKLNCPPGGR